MQSADLSVLQQRLQSFRKNIEKLQQIIQSGESNQTQKVKQSCKEDQDILVVKFKQGKFNRNEVGTVQKYQKEFQSLFKIYTDVLEQLKDRIEQEQKELEYKYNDEYQRRQTQFDDSRQNTSRGMRDDDSDPEDQRQPELEEVVHPDLDHDLQLIKEKGEDIAEIQQEVEATYKIMGDVAKMVFDQGKQLDVAEDNINQSNQNVKVAVMELEGAQVEHKSYMKKMVGGILVIVVIVMIVLLVVL